MTDHTTAAQADNKEIRAGFELCYATDADDPANVTDLGHFTNGWRACIMSQVGKPMVMKLEVDATAAIDLINDEVARLRALVADEQDGTAISQFLTDVMTAAGLVRHGKRCKVLAERLGKACMDIRLSGALASAPVAGEALGWRVRERRSNDGKLLDCFVEAPAVPGMAYAQEVLGDDYAEAQGGIEGKLKHCQMIVAWANAAPQASEAVRVLGIDLGADGIADVRNATLEEISQVLKNGIFVSVEDAADYILTRRTKAAPQLSETDAAAFSTAVDYRRMEDGVQASAPFAGEAQHDTDSVCAWQVWWNQNKSRFTTTRQASFAAFAAGKDWLNAAPQASEAVQLLRKVREDGYLSDTMNHRIAVLFACQPQASEAVPDAGIAASEDADEKMREVLQWIVDDAASGGVAKLRPQQEKRARAALSAQREQP